ncbi:MAG: hypothetical protein AB7S26_27730 [Sandaracinaceae bacterium]
MIRDAMRVVRAAPGRLGVLLFWLPFALLLSLFLIGVPLAAVSFGAILRATKSLASGGPFPPSKTPRGWSGMLVVAALLVQALGVATVFVVAYQTIPDVPYEPSLALALASIAPIAIGAALGSFVFAPFLALDHDRGPLDACAASFELAARTGPLAAARLGAVAGVPLGLAVAISGGLGLVVGEGAIAFFVPFVAVACGSFASVVLLATPFVNAAREVELEESGRDRSTGASAASQLRRLTLLAAPAVVLVVASFALAASRPSAMQEWARVPSSHAIPLGPQHGEQVVRIEGTSVTVRTVPGGVMIEADDGGGAGRVASHDRFGERALIVRPRVGHPGEYVVALTDGIHREGTVIDSDGVRLDDSLHARTFGRLGPLGTTVFVLGLALLFWIVTTTGFELGTARALAVPDMSHGFPSAARGIIAIEGRLRVAPGGKVLFRPYSALKRLFTHAGAGALYVNGEAWVEMEGGELRLRLPDREVPVLEGDPRSSGQDVVVLTGTRSLGAVGLRTASGDWPDEAVITLGRRADAEATLVRRAVRRASKLALPMNGLFAVVALVLLIRG